MGFVVPGCLASGTRSLHHSSRRLMHNKLDKPVRQRSDRLSLRSSWTQVRTVTFTTKRAKKPPRAFTRWHFRPRTSLS